MSSITVEETYSIMHQVLEALTYLHYKMIAHRDLKPANILVCARDPTLSVKVADFGASTELASDYLNTICGTRPYCAPEMWTGNYGRSVDIWALGVIGLQYSTGLPPFPPNRQNYDWRTWIAKIRQVALGQSVELDDRFREGLECMLEAHPRD